MISLREAIIATNNTPNDLAADQVLFNIPDGTVGQYYYQNDFTPGSVSLANISDAFVLGGESGIADFDPDHPFSWFRIDLDNALPALTIEDTLTIDGYSQWGASSNTQIIGNDGVLRIELTNKAADGNNGLTFGTGANGSALRGVNINEFGGIGILVNYDVDNVSIQGNFIGSDISGTRAVSNDGAGIQIRGSNTLVGGPNSADRNIISRK